MQSAVHIPVTVKTRIGIDDFDSYDFLCDFVQKVHQAGCQEFIVHARKAWLSGLSPKQNREIPPLNYERVYQLKQDFPHLLISINGGIKTIEEMQQHLKYVDGVMVGREAYQNPALLGHIDRALFDTDAPIITPRQAVENMFPYIEHQLSQGVYLNHIVRHMLGAFQNCKGARQWRRYLSENAYKAGAGIDMTSGSPLAAMVAAALDVPLSVLLTDGSAGGRQGAETALEEPTFKAFELRRRIHQDLVKRVLAAAGYKTEVDLAPLSNDLIQRWGQVVTLGLQNGILHRVEARELFLRRFAPVNAKPVNELPDWEDLSAPVQQFGAQDDGGKEEDQGKDDGNTGVGPLSDGTNSSRDGEGATTNA